MPEEDKIDFRDVSFQVLRGVASVEKCELQSVLEEFKKFLENRITSQQSSIKLKFGSTDTHSISLQETESIAKHGRLLIAHAIDNESKAIVYRNKPSQYSSRESKSFEVGQQAGSYIFVIRSPYEYDQGSFDGLNPSPSIYTKAMLRLARGIQWTYDNTDKVRNYSDVLQASEKGLNANMAYHLYELFESVKASEKYFTFNINSRFIQNENIRLTSFKVGRAEIDGFKSISDLLSNPREEILSFDVRIVKLSSPNPQQESFVHKAIVTIENSTSPFYKKQIIIELNKDDYQEALQGHGNAEIYKLEGKFEVSGTKLELKDVYKFET